MSAASNVPLFTFDHRSVIHNADGTKSLRWNQAEYRTDPTSPEVFSLQPDGSVQTRPDSAIGPWEKGKVSGDRLIFTTQDARAVFAWQD
jgi:hypothetical protein